MIKRPGVPAVIICTCTGMKKKCQESTDAATGHSAEKKEPVVASLLTVQGNI